MFPRNSLLQQEFLLVSVGLPSQYSLEKSFIILQNTLGRLEAELRIPNNFPCNTAMSRLYPVLRTCFLDRISQRTIKELFRAKDTGTLPNVRELLNSGGDKLSTLQKYDV